MDDYRTDVETLVEAFDGDDEEEEEQENYTMHSLAMTKLPSAERPQSASSAGAISDDIETFELPASLSWLTQAASHPGAVSLDDTEPSGKRQSGGSALMDTSRGRTPPSPEAAAAPRRRSYMSRPQPGASRGAKAAAKSNNMVPRKGGLSAMWRHGKEAKH